MHKFLRSFLCSSLLAGALLSSTAAFAAPELSGQINLNTASQEQLELLPGVGPAIAKKVVDYRAQKPFEDPTHLMRIKGIGRKTFAKLKPYLAVKGESTLHEVEGGEQTKK